MAVPRLVHFDRFAQLTFGLITDQGAPEIRPNGIALVTKWLSGEQWDICTDAISTSWGGCYGAPDTDWESCYAEPSTTWTDCT